MTHPQTSAYLLSLLITYLLASSLAFADSASTDTNTRAECYFDYKKHDHCAFSSENYQIHLKVLTEKVSRKESKLLAIQAIVNEKSFTLPITQNTSIQKGHIGLISFSDINFDTIPDLAISTSFGIANQAFDYWVYNPDTMKFLYVGNFVNLVLDPGQKSVTSIAKSNAAVYIKREYTWKGFTLVPK